MDCLSETETDVEKKTFLPSGNLENITQAKKIIPITEGGSCRSQMKSLLGNKRIFEVKSPEFSPLKHYLNSLYGFSDIDPDAKIVCIIEPNEDDYLATMASKDKQRKSAVECWHVHRRCFAWSFSVGTLIVLLGLTCLLLGFLLPRHSALVSPMGNNEEMLGMNAHFNNSDSSISSVNILDHKAIEHNNVLDTLKLSGGMASCFGCLLLLMTFILPPGSHPSKGFDEEEQPPTNINQLNEALRNCGF